MFTSIEFRELTQDELIMLDSLPDVNTDMYEATRTAIMKVLSDKGAIDIQLKYMNKVLETFPNISIETARTLAIYLNHSTEDEEYIVDLLSGE